MNTSNRRLPSIRALSALERVAKLGNVTRAAESLNTSQSAVSRHLSQLEADLGVALITRDGRGIALTQAGRIHAQGVAEALAKLREAADRVQVSKNELVIACTHEVSHLVLMPRYGEIKSALGQQTHIRIVTCDYPAVPAAIDAGADIVFEYRTAPPPLPYAAIVHEEITPAASPDFIERHKAELSEHPALWQRIRRLALTKDNLGWANWTDWFELQHVALPPAPDRKFDNYVYALEAATRGEGVVLAWRGFADQYLDSGQLVPLGFGWQKCSATLYAVPTSRGLGKKLTTKCIKILSSAAL
ncbi:LysR family transcriptional regulator [Cognatishimia sp. WU-CL00825]|uniref:LysR family transcriptional regulator n=1 Tax=Cognatishimia sp. WU-CL00825 TaxID=3127658 RepID=UPI0031064F56